jgi:uncharacterized protein (DUF111 family)
MTIRAIGYGAGQADFAHPNLLRLVVGETVEEQSGTPASHSLEADSVVLLETNLDDIRGEQTGYCVEQLWQAGALDVSLAPLQMKKGRPGVLLRVQAAPTDADRLTEIVFRETTTLGLRRSVVGRLRLSRQCISVDTSWGRVTGIVARLPDGSPRFSPEYADCAQLARQQGIALEKVTLAACQAFALEQEPESPQEES